VYLDSTLHTSSCLFLFSLFLPHPLPSLLLASQGEEFLYRATEVKNIWLPMGEVFAS